MNKKIDETISKIKEDEEKKYGIPLKVDTPTVITYFKDNLKKGNFSLKKMKKVIMNGIKYYGMAYPGISYICVFNKNHKLINDLKHPLDRRYKNLNELIAVRVALHEIRHVIQIQREDLFTDYDSFCNIYLNTLDDYSYLYGNDHNELYNEIDANLYAGENGIKYFNDKDSKDLFENLFNLCLYKKNIYDFDYFFDFFVSDIQKNGFDDNDAIFKYRKYISIYFNKDGSFKNVKDIINNPSFKISSKLSVKILSSNAFLENIDFYELEKDEKEIILKAMLGNISLLINSKETNKKLFKDNRITFDEYIEGFKKINEILTLKENIIDDIKNKGERR